MTGTELIVALDVGSIAEVERHLRDLHGTVTLFKVGLQLFTAHGKRAVDLVHRSGGRVFLDLKLHDIPQTVAHAVREAQSLGVHSLSVHLSSGRDVLEAAAAVHPRPKLWGVTVLTSLSSEDLQAIHPRASVRPTVRRLAELGRRCGIDGTICSGQEVPLLRRSLGPDAVFVTPGIRPAGSDLNDQKRVLTPGAAARLGIRYVVVGRPITHAAQPRAAAQDILAEIRNAVPGAP
ncbi:MAG: orotidine-5'-phosphate decarboxylase [Elusimicrobia bacterium]|nr:orotidine-5'-phosphate decarboxylase [Elusimicrobiota bacterium]